MCGITGIIGKGRVNGEAVEVMTGLLAHRGPDGDGFWSSDDGQVILGHRRLAVIDPTPAGAQPMQDSEEHLTITFNGEIYNYLELAERLKSEGAVFRSSSDTEVLLQAYKFWGEDCVSELNGMFAFAIFDQHHNRLFCARDRFGEKPFYFSSNSDFFAFASEYKSLLALEGVGHEIDELSLLRFMHQPRQGLDDERQTIFGAICQLLPAERLTLDVDSLDYKVERYWDIKPSENTQPISKQEAAHTFRDLLTDSVKLRMRSDVPVGSCLSGGLDSSSIVCLNREIVGPQADYHTFTGSFPGASTDETEFANTVIEQTNAGAHYVEPSAGGFENDLAGFMWMNELPVGSASQYAQWSVFRLAAENNVTVLLDGQGADELLGGYEQYFVSYLDAIGGTAPAEDLAAERRAIEKRYPMAFNAESGLGRHLPGGLRHGIASVTGKGSDFLFGLKGDVAKSVDRANTRTLDTALNPLGRALKDDCLHAHLPTLLRYGDRNSMAHSREVRLPFCDHRLAEFVFSLPPEYLMGQAETKHLLREAMKGLLPQSIRERWNKQGFLPPQEQWFSGSLSSRLDDVFSSQAFRTRSFWNVSWWSRVLHRFKGGERHLAWVLWRPYILENWFDHFLGRISGQKRVPVFQRGE